MKKFPDNDAFKKIRDVIVDAATKLKGNLYVPGIEYELYDLYNSGELTYISSGFPKHSISIILYENYMIYTLYYYLIFVLLFSYHTQNTLQSL